MHLPRGVFKRQGSCLNERGVTLLFLMFSVVIIGISLTVAAKQWKTIVQRELEADLLSKGLEIQRALALYSATKKAGRVKLETGPKGKLKVSEIYPTSLEELTRPPKPFLRKVYRDPLGRGDWDLIRAPNGGIMGVRSRSTESPIKKSGFPDEVRHFENLPRYQDWIFQHPNASSSKPAPKPTSAKTGKT